MRTTEGIWSPITSKYEVATPKHLMATAASMAYVSRGNATLANAPVHVGSVKAH